MGIFQWLVVKVIRCPDLPTCKLTVHILKCECACICYCMMISGVSISCVISKLFEMAIIYNLLCHIGRPVWRDAIYSTWNLQNNGSTVTVCALVLSWSLIRGLTHVHGQPSYLCSLLSFPSHRCTRSSSLITLSRPSLTSRLKMANRSFYHSAPVLWNNLPSQLRQVVHHVTPSISNSPVSDHSTSLFLKKLKTNLFHSSFPT